MSVLAMNFVYVRLRYVLPLMAVLPTVGRPATPATRGERLRAYSSRLGTPSPSGSAALPLTAAFVCSAAVKYRSCHVASGVATA